MDSSPEHLWHENIRAIGIRKSLKQQNIPCALPLHIQQD